MTTSKAKKPAAAGAAKRAPAAPKWKINTPKFEADAICPLMPVWPWGGHRGWAYDLVRFIKPDLIVELGVHWGTSFFAFAQAVKDAKLPSKLVGVDTWRGDNHTGPYGTQVIGTVRRIAAEYYPKLPIDLLPMTFDEALPQVADNSINLLHIDGFHEYDAVSHDFDTWLPKLAPDGIILLHDVADTTGYGSAAYWRDLLTKYPGFSFEHSWGLGVVFPKGRRWFDAITKANVEDKIPLYTFRAQLERANIEAKDIGDMAVSRLNTINEMGVTIKDRDAEVKLLNSIVKDRDSEIGLLKNILSDRDHEIANLGRELTSIRIAIDEKHNTLEGAWRQVHEITQRVHNLEAQVNANSQRAQAAETELASQRIQAQQLQASMDELNAAHRATIATLESANTRIADLSAACQRLEGDVAGLQDERSKHLSRITDTEHRHDVLAADIQALVARIHQDREQAEDLRRQMLEKDDMMQQLRQTIDQINADLEMLALRIEQLERLEIERERREEEKEPGNGRQPNPQVAKAKRIRR